MSENGANEDRYLILAIVLVGIFMSVLDGSIVTIALPTITGFFGAAVSSSGWVVNAYLIAMTGLLLIFGRISEYSGKVMLFLTGLSIFTASSLACGLSSELDQLIFFRVIQAIGASMVFSISTAIVVQAFPEGERGRALGFIGTTVALGGITGPVLGGLIVDSLGWEYVFLVNVPIGMFLLLVAFRYLRLDENLTETLDMDWIGSVAIVVSVVSLMLFLNGLAVNPDVDDRNALLLPVFIVSFLCFLWAERSHRRPIIDMSVFRVKKFSYANASLFLSFMVMFMFNLLMPFYFEGVMGFRPSHVGMVLIVVPIVMAVISPLSGWMYDRVHSAYHSSFGIFLMALSLLAIGYYVRSSDLSMLIACFALYGLGNGLFQSPNNTEVMSALSMEESGIASSVISTVRNLGMSFGASLGSILLSAGSSTSLSATVSVAIMIAAAVCFAGVLTSLLRNAG
jgi:EmrB/QacA subfamily drug resistance transporter